MNDLEIIKKCARKMDLTILDVKNGNQLFIFGKFGSELYDPLRNDTQAMAMVKKFNLSVSKQKEVWACYWTNKDSANGKNDIVQRDPDLNSAICECVARLP